MSELIKISLTKILVSENDGENYYPKISCNTVKCIFSWTQTYSSVTEVRYRLYDVNDNTLDSINEVDAGGSKFTYNATTAFFDNKFLIVWSQDKHNDDSGSHSESHSHSHPENHDGYKKEIYARYHLISNPANAISDTDEIYSKGGRTHLNPQVLDLNYQDRLLITYPYMKLDGSDRDIYGEVVEAKLHSGTHKIKKEEDLDIELPNNDDQIDPKADILSDGSSILVWANEINNNRYDIYGQRFDNDGKKLNDEFRISNTENYLRSQTFVKVIDDNNIVVAWVSKNEDGDKNGVFFQRINNQGNKIGSIVQVNSQTLGNQFAPQITLVPNSEGKFIVSWLSDNSQYGVNLQLFINNGEKQGQEKSLDIDISLERDSYQLLCSDIDHCLITWQSKNDGSNYKIFKAHFSYNDRSHTDSHTLNITETASETQSETISASKTVSTTLSGSSSESNSGGPGGTESISGTGSETITRSSSASKSQSETVSASDTVSATISRSSSESNSGGPGGTLSLSSSGSETITDSSSASKSQSETVSASDTISATLSGSSSESNSGGPGGTLSLSNSGSETITDSATVSESQSDTASASLSRSSSESNSGGPGGTESISGTGSETITKSVSISQSESTSDSTSVSVSESTSESFSTTDSPSQSLSRSETTSSSVSESSSFSLTRSKSRSESLPCHDQAKNARIYIKYFNIEIESVNTENTHIKTLHTQTKMQNDFCRSALFSPKLVIDHEVQSFFSPFTNDLQNNEYILDGKISFVSDCTNTELIYNPQYITTDGKYFYNNEFYDYDIHTTAPIRNYCFNKWRVFHITDSGQHELGPGQCSIAKMTAIFKENIKAEAKVFATFEAINAFGQKASGNDLKSIAQCVLSQDILESLGSDFVVPKDITTVTFTTTQHMTHTEVIGINSTLVDC